MLNSQNCVVMTAALMRKDAQQMVYVRLARIGLEDLAVKVLGSGDVSNLVEAYCPRKCFCNGGHAFSTHFRGE
jgi:hypothetical protein